MPALNLRTPLTLRSSFGFPLQSPAARRDVVVGAIVLLLPGLGWILNLGHRVVVVHRLLHDQEPWPAWRPVGPLLRHGALTFLGMALYYSPGVLLGWLARTSGAEAQAPLLIVATLLLVLATLAIPGFMTHYCVAFDPGEILRPVRALGRCFGAGPAYWKAWGIALTALACSFLGLFAMGVGFLLTSVWFWQVAGFSFATTFGQRVRAVETPTLS